MEGEGKKIKRRRGNKILLDPINKKKDNTLKEDLTKVNNNNNKQNNIVRTFETKYGNIDITKDEIDFVESDDFEISLPNIGATCFMNTCLNSFLSDKELFLFCAKIYNHITEDENYQINEAQLITDILSHNSKNPGAIAYKPQELQDRINRCLFKNFCELCYVLYHINNKDKGASFNSTKTVEVLRKIAETIRKDRPDVFGDTINGADAKDAYLYFAENFQTVFKILANKENIKTNTLPFTGDQLKPLKTYLLFLQDQIPQGIFSKNNPIQNFWLTNESINQCLSCKTNSYNNSLGNVKIFPLNECAKYHNINIEKNKYVPLESCLLYDVKTDFFTGDNKYYCNSSCKALKDAEYTTFNAFPQPESLEIVLERGKKNCHDVDMKIPEAYCANEAYGIYYELEYVGIHIDNGGYNHFISNIKKKNKNGKDIWCTVNDGWYQKQPHMGGKPYLLKYKKISKERFEQIKKQNSEDRYREQKRHPHICDPVTFSKDIQAKLYSKNYLYQKYIFENKEKLLSDNYFLNLTEEGKKKYLYDMMAPQEKEYLRDVIKNAPGDKNINTNNQKNKVNNANYQLNNSNNYQNLNYQNNIGFNQNPFNFEQFKNMWLFAWNKSNNVLNNNNYLNNINNGFKNNNNFILPKLNINNISNNQNNTKILQNIIINNINSKQNNANNINILPNININKMNNINNDKQNVQPKITTPIIVNDTTKNDKLTNINNKIIKNNDNTQKENKNKINNGTTNQKKKKKKIKLIKFNNDTTKKVESNNDKNQNNTKTNNINVLPNINNNININIKKINKKEYLPKIVNDTTKNDKLTNINNKIIKNNNNKYKMFNKNIKLKKINNIPNKEVYKKTNYNLNKFFLEQNIEK